MMTNLFKKALLAGEPQVGIWLSLGDATSAELCSSTGFQWALIDGEHTPHHLLSLLAQLKAVELGAALPVVRIPTGDATLIKQVLDMGGATILVPMVETAEQARHLVRAMRYAPEGFRGVGASAARATRWGADTDYLDHANAQACLLVQVETAAAIENLEAICQVDGVDGVFIGPADLSTSLGHRGNPGHPDVQDTIDKAIATIVESGKAAGILTPDTALARHYLALGATFVAVGIDVFILAQGARRLAAEFGLGHGPGAARKSY